MSESARRKWNVAPPEEGSLLVAMIVIAVLMIMAGVMISDILFTQDFTTSINVHEVAQQAGDAGVSDALYQLDQYANGANPPNPLCVTNDASLTPVIPSCTGKWIDAPATPGMSWYYTATIQPEPNPDQLTYKVVSTGTVHGITKTVFQDVSEYITHDGIDGIWGLNANGQGLTVQCSNSTGTISGTDTSDPTDYTTSSANGVVDPDTDGDCDVPSSAGVNAGSTCSGINANQLNVYGKFSTAACTGSVSGTGILNPKNPYEFCLANGLAPFTTRPPTVCVPPAGNTVHNLDASGNPYSYTVAYPAGCDPASVPNWAPPVAPQTPAQANPCCPFPAITQGTGGNSIHIPDVNAPALPGGVVPEDTYICQNTQLQVDNVQVLSGNTGDPNGGVVQIFVFAPPPAAAPKTWGAKVFPDVILGPSFSLNAPNGPSTFFQLDVSQALLCGPPLTGSPPAPAAPGTTGGGGLIGTPHGSSVGPGDGEVYAPNDQSFGNGAPFTSWVGQFLVCYMNLNGTGGGSNGATFDDNVTNVEAYTPWSTTFYHD